MCLRLNTWFLFLFLILVKRKGRKLGETVLLGWKNGEHCVMQSSFASFHFYHFQYSSSFWCLSLLLQVRLCIYISRYSIIEYFISPLLKLHDTKLISWIATCSCYMLSFLGHQHWLTEKYSGTWLVVVVPFFHSLTDRVIQIGTYTNTEFIL